MAMSDWEILHVFADHGVESEVLGQFGTVVRYTLNPVQYDHSYAIRGDASNPMQLPFDKNEFDLVVAHPPCTAWSTMPGANKDGDAPELISEARAIGKRYGKHYIIENKPRAPLESPTVLDGRLFGLPIEYKRAFETSFGTTQPPHIGGLWDENATSPFFYSEKSVEWWAAVKGYPPNKYPKEHMAKNALPAQFVRYLVLQWLAATGDSEGQSDYSTYNKDMDEKRSRAVNADLKNYNGKND